MQNIIALGAIVFVNFSGFSRRQTNMPHFFIKHGGICFSGTTKTRAGEKKEWVGTLFGFFVLVGLLNWISMLGVFSSSFFDSLFHGFLSRPRLLLLRRL